MGKFTVGPDTLARWPVEKIVIHRAMLLYGMQHTGGSHMIRRSYRAVARAIGLGETSVRGWCAAHRWEERLAATPDCEAVCMQLYRANYLEEFGAVELPVVAPRVVVPMARGVSAPQGTEADDVISAARQHSTAAVRAEAAVAASINDRRRAERTKVENFRGLVDAALGETARLLKERKLKLTAKDIPSLLSARQVLSEWLNHHDDRSVEQRAAPDSARVRHAKDTGRDILDAVWEDLDEMRTILGVLRTRRDVAPDQLRTEYETARAAAEPALAAVQVVVGHTTEASE